eukprot:CAMPEP_0198289170 /NCGR_PEP_ID=MMETSP1449-20131203/7463_1 /TAXON_ID=420275 /ORGANISM="Attheya septentrionalis, Strain CCMP2084" /LENGTH=80 /DNA_ID=CAMNT_0043987467 /DNA_START=246 /DNA_END=488 /DNA_ORIENTATION=-
MASLACQALSRRSTARNLSSESNGGDALHSTDIAFKPAESGWGFTNKYNSNFDNIFGKKNEGEKKDSPSSTSAEQVDVDK